MLLHCPMVICLILLCDGFEMGSMIVSQSRRNLNKRKWGKKERTDIRLNLMCWLNAKKWKWFFFCWWIDRLIEFLFASPVRFEGGKKSHRFRDTMKQLACIHIATQIPQAHCCWLIFIAFVSRISYTLFEVRLYGLIESTPNNKSFN